jgi:hypothetical protein
MRNKSLDNNSSNNNTQLFFDSDLFEGRSFDLDFGFGLGFGFGFGFDFYFYCDFYFDLYFDLYFGLYFDLYFYFGLYFDLDLDFDFDFDFYLDLDLDLKKRMTRKRMMRWKENTFFSLELDHESAVILMNFFLNWFWIRHKCRYLSTWKMNPSFHHLKNLKNTRNQILL